MSNNYIYGPVSSRRLGRSLGIDLVPFKVCSYDCIYCQLGRTANNTIARREYNNAALVIEEVENFLKRKIRIDYMTLSGSGEPTLNSAMGEIIAKIKSMTDVPVVVLTNSSLLSDKQVQTELMEADIIVPSMDAVSADVYNRVNKPNKKLDITNVLDGLIDFSEAFNGKIYLEILFVKDINDNESEIEKMRKIIQKIKVDAVHLNTVVRPPCERNAVSLNQEEMYSIKKMFGTAVPVVVIASSAPRRTDYDNVTEDKILNLLKRRPCRLIDMASALGVHQNELIKYITELRRKNVITNHSVNGSYSDYYTVK